MMTVQLVEIVSVYAYDATYLGHAW